MSQIADAPWIREAENDGWGPQDDGLDDAIGYLEDAYQSIDIAITRLEEAENEFAQNGESVILVDETDKLAEISEYIRKKIRDYKL